MKTSKKALSILLAILMMVSCCALALPASASGETVTLTVKCEPAGAGIVKVGYFNDRNEAVILDSDFYEVSAQFGLQGSELPSAFDAYVEAYPSSGFAFIGWYDADGKYLGFFNEVALHGSETDIAFTEDLTLTARFVSLQNLVTLKTETDALKDGDWYIDIHALVAKLYDGYEVDEETLKEAEDEARATVLCYAPDAGLIIGYTSDPEEGSIFSRAYSSTDPVGAVFISAIKQYQAPAQPENPGQPDNPNQPNQPENPGGNDNNPQQPQSGSCKYCGETHKGFPGVLIGFFHSILALFGLRK